MRGIGSEVRLASVGGLSVDNDRRYAVRLHPANWSQLSLQRVALIPHAIVGVPLGVVKCLRHLFLDHSFEGLGKFNHNLYRSA